MDLGITGQPVGSGAASPMKDEDVSVKIISGQLVAKIAERP